MSCDFSACCVAPDMHAQIRESVSKMKMEIQKKICIPRYNEMGPDPPGKSRYMGFYRE